MPWGMCRNHYGGGKHKIIRRSRMKVVKCKCGKDVLIDKVQLPKMPDRAIVESGYKGE